MFGLVDWTAARSAEDVGSIPATPLCSRLEFTSVWCNGNTTVSKSVDQGSIPWTDATPFNGYTSGHSSDNSSVSAE